MKLFHQVCDDYFIIVLRILFRIIIVIQKKDTEAESAPVVKRPILIKGEGEYNKNYQLCSNENDSLHYSTYYGCDSGDKEVEVRI